jgi:hypothetical protein
MSACKVFARLAKLGDLPKKLAEVLAGPRQWLVQKVTKVLERLAQPIQDQLDKLLGCAGQDRVAPTK